MRRFLLAIFLFSTLMSYSQEKLKGFIDFSQNVNYGLTITESNLNFGVDYAFTNTSISVFGTYGYGGVFDYVGLPNYNKNFSAFQLDYHLLGGGAKLRLRGKDKLYRPTFKATFITEIASKYRGGKIEGVGNSSLLNNEVYFSPTDHIYEIKNWVQGSHGGSYVFQNYRSYHYISTPLVGSFFFENEFKATDNLYINLGIGYLVRIFRFYKNEWGLNETMPKVEIIETHSFNESSYGKIETYDYLEFELGISYLFSFKSKK